MTTPDVVLVTIADVATLAPLLDADPPVFSIPADARETPFLLCDYDKLDPVQGALKKAKLTALPLHGDELSGVPVAIAGELRAVAGNVVASLDNGGALFATNAVIIAYGATVAAVQAALAKAKIAAVPVRTLLEARPQQSEAEAIERIKNGLEYVEEPWIEPLLAYVRGERSLSFADYSDDCEDLGETALGALGPAIEQWNPTIAERCVRLFLQEKKDSVWLRGDDARPALGVDRESLFVSMLLRAGASEPRALAVALAAVEGPHTLTRALVAQPEKLRAVFDASPANAFDLTAAIGLWKHAFESSPTWRAHVTALLAAHHPALGASFLYEVSKTFTAQIDRAHLEHAARTDTDNAEKLQWAGAQLEEEDPKRHAGALAFVLETWARHVEPGRYGAQVEAMLRNEKRPLVFDAVWLSFVTMLERNPANPFDDSSGFYTFVYSVAKMRNPPKPIAARLAAWLAANPKLLGGSLTKALQKKAGTAPAKKPAPYDNSDLDGLDDALVKGIEAARKKSWDAEVKLPKGASAAAIEKAEKALGCALPDDVREFYLRHDGAGNDECFNGCLLYSIERAVKQRATLESYAKDGAHAIDPSWLPLTDDGGGNHHCVVLSGKNAGQIMDFDHETGPGRKISARFATLLQKARWSE